MSLDQFMFCRRAPKLPDDLPRASEWKTSTFDDVPVYTFDGREWLINILIENQIDDELRTQLKDELFYASIDATPADYPVLISVSLEPAGANEDGIEMGMAVMRKLEETCDGITLPI